MASTRHWRLFGVAAGLPAAAVGVTVAVGVVRVTGDNPVEVIGFLPVFVLTSIVLCGLNVVEVVYLWPRVFGSSEWYRLGRSRQAGLGLVGPISTGMLAAMLLTWAAMRG
jgi:hypothetical protein